MAKQAPKGKKTIHQYHDVSTDTHGFVGTDYKLVVSDIYHLRSRLENTPRLPYAPGVLAQLHAVRKVGRHRWTIMQQGKLWFALPPAKQLREAFERQNRMLERQLKGEKLYAHPELSTAHPPFNKLPAKTSVVSSGEPPSIDEIQRGHKSFFESGEDSEEEKAAEAAMIRETSGEEREYCRPPISAVPDFPGAKSDSPLCDISETIGCATLLCNRDSRRSQASLPDGFQLFCCDLCRATHGSQHNDGCKSFIYTEGLSAKFQAIVGRSSLDNKPLITHGPDKVTRSKASRTASVDVALLEACADRLYEGLERGHKWDNWRGEIAIEETLSHIINHCLELSNHAIRDPRDTIWGIIGAICFGGMKLAYDFRKRPQVFNAPPK